MVKILLKFKLVEAYWKAIQGFRKKAVILVSLMGLAGLFEGSALLTLGPIFQAGSSLEFKDSRIIQIYQSLGVSNDKLLSFAIIVFVILGLLSAIVNLVVGIFTLRFQTQQERSLREKLTRALIKMKWAEFISLSLGDINKAILMESYYIGFGTKNFLMGLGFLIVCFFFTLVAIYISPKMTFFILVFAVFLGLGYKLVANKVYRYSQEMSRFASLIGNKISEVFGELKFFRAIGSSQSSLEKARSLFRNYESTNFRGHIFQPIMRFTFEAGGIFLIGALISYSFFISKTPFSELVVFLIIFYRLVPRIMQCNNLFQVAWTYQPWFQTWEERLNKVSANKEENFGMKAPLFEKSLNIQNLHFRFSREGMEVLQDIHFTVNKGSCVALVGESGSGKSTLINLVTGLLRPCQGKILLDGVPLQELEIDQWRSKIGLVLQDTPVLHTTVLENITLGQSVNDDQKVRRSAELAHAWEFIQELPKGMNTIVGEKGSRLSGGQKQRLVLARALYRDPWILILDEATSALDGQSELKIHDALEALKGRLTILMVAHRLKTVSLADKILVLNQGKIVERGGWNQLMKKKDGQFRKMAALQGISSPLEEIEVKK